MISEKSGTSCLMREVVGGDEDERVNSLDDNIVGARTGKSQFSESCVNVFSKIFISEGTKNSASVVFVIPMKGMIAPPPAPAPEYNIEPSTDQTSVNAVGNILGDFHELLPPTPLCDVLYNLT